MTNNAFILLTAAYSLLIAGRLWWSWNEANVQFEEGEWIVFFWLTVLPFQMLNRKVQQISFHSLIAKLAQRWRLWIVFNCWQKKYIYIKGQWKFCWRHNSLTKTTTLQITIFQVSDCVYTVFLSPLYTFVFIPTLKSTLSTFLNFWWHYWCPSWPRWPWAWWTSWSLRPWGYWWTWRS